jgi:hypothetical protein
MLIFQMHPDPFPDLLLLLPGVECFSADLPKGFPGSV